MRIGTKIASGFGLGLIMFLALGLAFYTSLQRQNRRNQALMHTNQVVEELNGLLSIFQDAETGQRGFMLTGRNEYLDPYHAAINRSEQTLVRLGALVDGNPGQQQNLQQVRKLCDEKFFELRETIRLHREGGPEKALSVVLSDRGKQTMDHIRALIGRMRVEEEGQLQQQTREAEASTRRTFGVILFGTPLAIIILGLAAVMITRNIAGPLSAITDAARRISQGELVLFPEESDRTDQVGELQRSFRVMTNWLRRMSNHARQIAERDLTMSVVPVSERDELGRSFATMIENLRAMTMELQTRAEEAAAQNEELTQQTEELSQQTEEASEQAEELAHQNEELQAQSEEIQELNTHLTRRESLLQTLVEWARISGSEQAILRDICARAVDMFGEAATVVVVYEQKGDQLIIRTAAGKGEASPVPEWLPSEHRFTELVIRQNQTACLNDTSLRRDLSILEVTGHPPMQAVLCAPMRREGRAFGAVAIYSDRKQEWTAEQFRLAEWLAGGCSQILEILRLQSDLRRQAALIDLSPDAIMVRRPDGSITLWGRGAQSLYGWTKDEALECFSHSLLKTRFPQPLDEIEQQFQESGAWSGEVVHSTKDGREIIVRSRWLAQRDPYSDNVEVLESNVDMTDYKRVEDALRDADRRKNEFLATLSHELRNPLAPIRYALTMLDAGGNHTSAKQVIERQLGHLVHLVDDLLDMTRIGSNKIRLRKRLVDLATVVQHAAEAAAPDIERAKHQVVVSLPKEQVWLDADTDRLDQVLINLLNNAARYTPAGGRIDLIAESKGDDVSICVRDTGIGLDEKDLQRVFEMFTQVGEPGHGGLGIGLALVKGLVELHGGRVEARSKGLGQGSEFCIHLPQAERKPSAAPVTEGEIEPASRRRILVVDDNVDAAEMMKALLETYQHEVRVAYDGRGALEAVREFEPDIGLFDIGLPDIDGYELARRVRQDPKSRGMCLIAVTGWGQEEDRRRARESGFDDHLTKPADPDMIKRLIANARRTTAV